MGFVVALGGVHVVIETDEREIIERDELWSCCRP